MTKRGLIGVKGGGSSVQKEEREIRASLREGGKKSSNRHEKDIYMAQATLGGGAGEERRPFHSKTKKTKNGRYVVWSRKYRD